MPSPHIGYQRGGLALQGALTNIVTLGASDTYVLPAGFYKINLGAYTFLQNYDNSQGAWVCTDTAPNGAVFANSDGYNFRLANLTGCVIGALITTAGSSYATAPSVTASAGGSTFQSILGGAISTTATVATGGTGFNHIPTILIAPPPNPGIQATATTTVSAGALGTVTITNQGAGYTSVPAYTVIPSIFDTITGQPALTLALDVTKTGTVTGMICTDSGTNLTSVPTLTVTAAPAGGTTAAATAIMCFTLTGYTLTSNGSGYTSTSPFSLMATGGMLTAGTPAWTNPASQTGLLLPRVPQAYGQTVSTVFGTQTQAGTSFVLVDGGLMQAVPTISFITGTAAVPTLFATATATVGGISDTSFIQPI